jgi:hypothetical protein
MVLTHARRAFNGEKMSRKTVQSALVIKVPDDLCAQVDAIRMHHDKSYGRWPPRSLPGACGRV